MSQHKPFINFATGRGKKISTHVSQAEKVSSGGMISTLLHEVGTACNSTASTSIQLTSLDTVEYDVPSAY